MSEEPYVFQITFYPGGIRSTVLLLVLGMSPNRLERPKVLMLNRSQFGAKYLYETEEAISEQPSGSQAGN